MRVTVYSPTWYPPVVDGTSVQAERLARLLARVHEVTGLTFAVDRAIRPLPSDARARPPVVRLPAVYTTAGRYPLLSGLPAAETLAALEPEVTHVRGWYQLAAARDVLLTARGLSSKTYWHADGLFECHSRFKGRKGYRRLVDEVAQAGVVFVGQSKADLDVLEELGIPKAQCTSIAPIVPQPRRPIAKEWSRPIVVSLGRFFSYKRHQEVFDAGEKAGIGECMLFVGSADTRGGMAIARRLRRSKAQLLLNPSERKLRRVLERATHIVLASTRETLGISVLEGVCLGAIPIVRVNPGIRSYLPPEFLFQTSAELAHGLQRVTDSAHSMEMFRRLAAVRRSLSSSRIMSAYDLLYRSSR